MPVLVALVRLSRLKAVDLIERPDGRLDGSWFRELSGGVDSGCPEVLDELRSEVRPGCVSLGRRDRYCTASATSSDGWPLALTATTMYWVPSTMYVIGRPL